MLLKGVRRWHWAAAGAGLAIVLSASYLLLGAGLRRLLEASYAGQMHGALRVVALHIGGRLDGVAEGLRGLAASPLGREGAPVAAYVEGLERLRAVQPRLVRAGLVFDRSGGLLRVDPPTPWRDEERAAIELASRKAFSASTAAAAATSRPEPGNLVFLVAPVPGTAGPEVGAVGAAVDADELARRALDGLVRGGPGLAFLVAGDGKLVVAAGAGAERTAASLARLVEARSASSAGESLEGPGEGGRIWTGTLGEASAQLLAATEPVKLGGGAFFVGVAVPIRWVAKASGPLLFGGATLLTGVLAGAAAALVSWSRKDLSEKAARRDAERWREVAERRQREGRWRGLADHTPCPLLCLLGTQVVAANRPAVSRLAQGDRSQLIGMDFLSFIPESDRGQLAEFLNGRVETRDGPETTRVELVARDGRQFKAALRASAVTELDETLLYVSWEEAAGSLAAEALLDTMGRAAPVTCLFTDASGLLQWANPRFAARTGLDPAAFYGRPLLPIVDIPHRRAVLAALARARHGKSSAGQVRIRCAGGAPLAVDFQTFPVVAGDETIGALFIAWEMGDESGAERDSPRLARDRAVSLFGTSLAHRLSNNVQALTGLLGEIRGKSGSDRDAPIDRAQRLAAEAVEDLRRFVAISRTGSGAQRPVELGPLVERWVDSAKQTLPPSVRLTVRRETADDRVVADAAQITLWLDVALAAAVGDMEMVEGAVEVGVTQGQHPGNVRITLADTGQADPGRHPDAEVARAHFGSRKTAQALAELIAVRHGGLSGSHARSGIGSRVWIELLTSPLPGGAEQTLKRGVRGGAVLLADDEEMVRTTLAATLREAGHEVVEAGNGLEAVERVLASPERFAVVVLDIVMPVMDGREALRRLRERAPGVPVVICTGYDPSGDDTLAAAGVLIKPFSTDEFLAKLSEFLGEFPGGPPGDGTMTS